MAVAIRPGPELLDDPRQLPHRRIGQPVAQRLWPGGLLLGITGAPFPMLGQRGQGGLFLLGRIGQRFLRRPADRHVQMDCRAMVPTSTAVSAELRGDGRAPVATLGAVAVVAEALHQRLPSLGDLLHAPPGTAGLAGEAISRKRRAHDMEGVFGASGRRIGQRLNHLVELHDRTRPAMRDHQREGVLVRRALVDEMNVQSVDFGDELVEAIERGLTRPPVVFVGPVVGQLRV